MQCTIRLELETLDTAYAWKIALTLLNVWALYVLLMFPSNLLHVVFDEENSTSKNLVRNSIAY